ncbi:hypothetical protein TELCIR_05395 [Teladorsagia circumcincta]|uniref:Uncharacterized protein n=1 Tax=Teladorsagia circumcincta TaxID=45464 RepID=A0A2G9UR83_TELCI|nr:hypothetical protein TELCIR_05395 [Teladorsagia circumcincta]
MFVLQDEVSSEQHTPPLIGNDLLQKEVSSRLSSSPVHEVLSSHRSTPATARLVTLSSQAPRSTAERLANIFTRTRLRQAKLPPFGQKVLLHSLTISLHKQL